MPAGVLRGARRHPAPFTTFDYRYRAPRHWVHSPFAATTHFGSPFVVLHFVRAFSPYRTTVTDRRNLYLYHLAFCGSLRARALIFGARLPRIQQHSALPPYHVFWSHFPHDRAHYYYVLTCPCSDFTAVRS